MTTIALLLASALGAQHDFRATIAVSLTHAQMVEATPANDPSPSEFPEAPSPPAPGPGDVPDVQPEDKPAPKPAAPKPAAKKPAAPPVQQYRYYNNRGWRRFGSSGGCANGRCG